MLNEKGQTLVLFILLLPLVFFVLLIIVNLSNINNQKIKINNTVRDVIVFALDNKDIDDLEEKINKLLEKNLTDVDYDVVISSDNLRISAAKKIDGVINILGLNNEIIVSYSGNFNTKEIIKE